MSYIVQRKDRFYVVAYDGLDPLTGKERRRWHPGGHDRDEAEAFAARLETRTTLRSAPRPAADHRRRVSHRDVDATQATPSPSHHRIPVRMVHRALHQPAIGDYPAAPLRTSTTSTTSTTTSLTDRWSHRRRARTQDGPRSSHDRPSALATPRADSSRANVASRHDAPRANSHVHDADPSTMDRAGQLEPVPRHARHHRLYPALHLAATPACVAVRSSDSRWCDLDTADAPAVDPSHRAMRRRATRRVRRQDPHQPTHASNSTNHRSTSSTLAATATTRRAPERHRRLDVLQHRPAATSTPNQSANCSTASCAAATFHGSDSTTCATPTPHCSSPPAYRSRSSPNDSVTPTRVHDPHLPTPAARHERRRRRPLRHHHRHRQNR